MRHSSPLGAKEAFAGLAIGLGTLAVWSEIASPQKEGTPKPVHPTIGVPGSTVDAKGFRITDILPSETQAAAMVVGGTLVWAALKMPKLSGPSLRIYTPPQDEDGR